MLRFLFAGGTIIMTISVPHAYRAVRTTASSDMLLAAAEQAWRDVPHIEWGPPEYLTRFKAVWNREGLYVRFDATDAAPWHTMTRRDDHLWEEEVVEIFVDPDRSGRRYAELEISPANVVCDVRMIEPWPDKQMDLAWDFLGLESRVAPLTTVNGRTAGWTATAFMPWADFGRLSQRTAVSLPPQPGDRWRFNVFRIKRPGGKDRPEEGAVQVAWSPNETPSFHVPDAFADLIFVER